jgi:hypothetical protein
LDNSSLASRMFAEGLCSDGAHADPNCNSSATVLLIVAPEVLGHVSGPAESTLRLL